jgi:biopolymer transport protein ExbB/TolQ
VVGFILMLGPLTAIQNIDVSSMRQVLSAMSSGMAVALFTTLCGLIGGILLKLQFYFLEGTTDQLIAMATEITEVYVVPVLEVAPPVDSRHAA